MKTAARALILASLVGTACSSDLGQEETLPSGSSSDPTGSNVNPNTDGVSPGTGGTNSNASGSPTSGGSGTGSVNPGSSGSVNPSEPMPNNGVCTPGVPASTQVPRLTNVQYNEVVKDVLKVSAPNGGSWSEGFEADSKAELSSTQWSQYVAMADKIAAAAMAGPLGSQLTCASVDAACFEGHVRSLGRQMFRRPLSDDEVAQFMTLMDVEPAGTPAEMAEALIYTLLISPSFLTRAELDAPTEVVPGTEQTAFKLSNYEVASRLSFLIWNSVPDAELSAAADAGKLQTKEEIAAQAKRMVGPEFRDKVAPVIVAAHRFYANISDTATSSRWGKTLHETSKFPEYKESQIEAFAEETDKFFAEVGFNGKFEDLFLSNVAYVNADTAPIYGLDPSKFGPELVRTELDPKERPGFLTRGAFLSSFAHEESTSPILRGVFIVTLMGGATGAPSPSALTTALPPGNYTTNREATQALTGVAADCKGCHWTNINPPGFVLENYSPVGSIQTKDPVYGGDIVTEVDTVPFPDGARPVANAYELMEGIAAGRKAKELYAQKWLTYATGREKNDFDTCTVQAIADNIEQGEYSLANVLADITQAESFRLRTAAQ